MPRRKRLNMQLIRDFTQLPETLRRGAVTIGNFDGVHLGHARIISQLIASAEAAGGPAVVFTFDPHPVRLLRPEECPPPLTWTDRKADLLGKLGVDAMVVYPTDVALLQLSPREFFDSIIQQGLGARAMVEGPNFFFGRERAGNVELLREYALDAGIRLDVVEPVQSGDAYVSSSRVRDLIAAGDVAGANSLLTQPYRIRGMVTHGAGRGASLGFPTANVEAIDTLLPAHGVYAGRAITSSGRWSAAINIGPNPTFGERSIKVEAHLIDFHESLYGQPLELDLLTRLRDVRTFASAEALKQQLCDDVRQAKMAGGGD